MPCKTIIKLNDYLRNLINRTEFLQYLHLLLYRKIIFQKQKSISAYFLFNACYKMKGQFFDKNAIFKVKGFTTTIKKPNLFIALCIKVLAHYSHININART